MEFKATSSFYLLYWLIFIYFSYHIFFFMLHTNVIFLFNILFNIYIYLIYAEKTASSETQRETNLIFTILL